jgi:CRISPR-associated protein Cas2
MHVIAAYDIGEKRVGKVLKTFRKYLTWIQNSVFMGDITKAQMENLKVELLEIIDENCDQVLFFSMRSSKMLHSEHLGKEFNPLDNFF